MDSDFSIAKRQERLGLRQILNRAFVRIVTGSGCYQMP
jgi:hypothetical protein